LADLIVTRKKDFRQAIQLAGITHCPSSIKLPDRLVVAYGGANDVTTSIEGINLPVSKQAAPAIVDPTGMIDVFHAALLSFILKEGWPESLPLLTAGLRYANSMAIEKAHGIGARSFPTHFRQLELYDSEMHNYRKLSGPYHSCFLSYSHQDQAFVDKLYADLRKWNVPCWFAPDSIRTGEEFRRAIKMAIRTSDKLLVVLSENSSRSRWVQWEVCVARHIEANEHRVVLCPISIVNPSGCPTGRWFTDLKKSRHICDFSNCDDAQEYEKSFGRLLCDLKKPVIP
jgi:hypothetical protein